MSSYIILIALSLYQHSHKIPHWIFSMKAYKSHKWPRVYKQGYKVEVWPCCRTQSRGPGGWVPMSQFSRTACTQVECCELQGQWPLWPMSPQTWPEVSLLEVPSRRHEKTCQPQLKTNDFHVPPAHEIWGHGNKHPWLQLCSSIWKSRKKGVS